MSPFNSMRRTAIALACLGMLAPPHLFAAPPQKKADFTVAGDIALDAQGRLTGQLLDAAGRPLQQSTVTITPRGGEPVETSTDAAGKFAFVVPQGGLYRLGSESGDTIVRVWTDGTAPPAARGGVLLVPKEALLRAQDGESFFPNDGGVGVGELLLAGLVIGGIAWAITDGDGDGGGVSGGGGGSGGSSS